jgi:hypothetical protein
VRRRGVGIVNTLRARAGVALRALTAAEASNFAATLFQERARELFLQGNRWFDLRRGNLPLTPAVGQAYAKGGTYGDQRCWPLPDVERAANPNLRPGGSTCRPRRRCRRTGGGAPGGPRRSARAPRVASGRGRWRAPRLEHCSVAGEIPSAVM